MWEMSSGDDTTPIGQPTSDKFKKSSRKFNVFEIKKALPSHLTRASSPSQLPIWDIESSRDDITPIGKPIVTRTVITPTGRSSTRHSKTGMPSVMDVPTCISPCTNEVESTVTTIQYEVKSTVSPIVDIMQDDSETEALVSPKCMGGSDYELSPLSTLLPEDSDINDTIIIHSHDASATCNSSICNYEKKRKNVGIRKTEDEICGPHAVLRALR